MKSRGWVVCIIKEKWLIDVPGERRPQSIVNKHIAIQIEFKLVNERAQTIQLGDLTNGKAQQPMPKPLSSHETDISHFAMTFASSFSASPPLRTRSQGI